MPAYILAHDLGTTGNKASLYSEQGVLKASTFYPYETYYPRTNWVEQDPQDWWRAVVEATRALLEQSRIAPSDVAVVSFSGQMMGCLPVDARGEPIGRSIIWADQRAVEQARRFAQAVGPDRVYRITGHRPSPAYSAAKIMWIRENEPARYDAAAKFVQAKDFVAARLTGVIVSDYSDASGTNLLDIERLRWSEELVAAAGIDMARLPELRPSADVIGRVLPEAARQTGLVAGTPVVIGGGDGSCATAGAGVAETGQAYNYLGSSSWIATVAPKPLYDPERRTFNWVHLDPALYVPCGTMQAAGGSYAWLKEALGDFERDAAALMGVSPYDLLNAEAERAPAGSDGLLFLPYLLGERSPHWNPNARGCFVGLKPTHRKSHIVRAVLEGVALNLRIILEAFQEQLAVREVRLIGGGARGATWRRILTDVFKIPTLKPTVLEEATSLGAAIAGGVGVGIFPGFAVARDLVSIEERLEPEPGRSAVYDRLYDVFKQAYRDLLGTFDALAALDR